MEFPKFYVACLYCITRNFDIWMFLCSAVLQLQKTASTCMYTTRNVCRIHSADVRHTTQWFNIDEYNKWLVQMQIHSNRIKLGKKTLGDAAKPLKTNKQSITIIYRWFFVFFLTRNYDISLEFLYYLENHLCVNVSWRAYAYTLN